MDYQNNQPHSMYQAPVPNKRSSGMETAAFALGIASIATCTCLYISIVCGALAIMFALLSKGGANSMSSRAKTALILGLIGLIISITLFTISFVYLLRTYGSIENILKAYCDMTGLDYSELYGELFSN